MCVRVHYLITIHHTGALLCVYVKRLFSARWGVVHIQKSQAEAESTRVFYCFDGWIFILPVCTSVELILYLHLMREYMRLEAQAGITSAWRVH